VEAGSKSELIRDFDLLDSQWTSTKEVNTFGLCLFGTHEFGRIHLKGHNASTLFQSIVTKLY
jgi:hypothetical protein